MSKRTPLTTARPIEIELQPWHEQPTLDLDPFDSTGYVVGLIEEDYPITGTGTTAEQYRRYVITLDDGRAITDQGEIISFITNQHTKDTNMHSPDLDLAEIDTATQQDYTLREMADEYPQASTLIERYTATGNNPHTRYIGGTTTTASQRKAARALWSELAWSNPSPVMWSISLDTDPAEHGYPQLYNAPHIAQLQCFELPDWHAHYKRGVDTFAVVYYLSSKTWVTRSGETLGDNKDKAGYLAVMDFITGEERAEELRLELVAAVRTLAGCASAKRPTDRDEDEEISEQARRYRRELSAL